MRDKLAILLCLSVITLVLYEPVRRCGFVSMDDNIYVSDNPQVLRGISIESLAWAFRNFEGGSWNPLVWISLMADAKIFGIGPAGFHVTNALLHVANTLLLFIVLQRMTGALWRSAFVAAFFAWHPLHVESVAWVSERKDVLSTFFWILTMWAYVRYVRSGERTRPRVLFETPSPQTPPRMPDKPEEKGFGEGAETGTLGRVRYPNGYYLQTILFFALGLMAKPMLVTLPFVLLLLDYWPLRRFSFSPQTSLSQQSTINTQHLTHPLLNYWPLRRFSFSPPTSLSQQSTINTQLSTQPLQWLILEKLPLFALSAVFGVITFVAQARNEAVSSLQQVSMFARLANAPISCFKYLFKTVWPVDLAVFYPYPKRFVLSQAAAALLVLAAITFGVIVGRKRHPFLPVGWFWYLGTLLPVIGLIQIGVQSMADRYTYIPQIGLFIIVAWGIGEVVSVRNLSKTAWAAACAALIACAALTRVQLGYWKDGVSLFTHTLAVTSQNYVAHYALGRALAGDGRIAEAMDQFEAALRIDPGYAPAHQDLGVLLTRTGHPDRAVEHYRAAIKSEPGFAETHVNLALALLRRGDVSEAVEHLRAAVQIEPASARFHNHLAYGLAAEGRLDEAIDHLREALRLDPADEGARENLNRALALKEESGR